MAGELPIGHRTLPTRAQVMGRNTSKVRNALPPYRGGATIQGLPEKYQNLVFKKTRWLVTVNQFISPPHYLVEKIRMNLAGRLTGGVPKEVGKQGGCQEKESFGVMD